MTNAELDEMLACMKYVLQHLSKQMKGRNEDKEWVEHELDAVVCACNEWAWKKGLDKTMTHHQARDLEVCAMGHIDYARKWCLYLAEWMYGVRNG